MTFKDFMGYEIEMEKKEKKTFKKKERILMKNTIKIMVATLILVLVTSMTTATAADAAKKKTYATKTVTVTSGKSKTVTTAKKIKKVAISSTNKNFTVKKTGNKKFKVSGTDKGKTQTVKVTYTNKYTQKFKIKTKAAKTTNIPSYAQKIVNELKPLLADPDKGLQTAMTWWEKPTNDKYENVFMIKNLADGKTVSTLYMDDIMKTYTTSQKKALILELYFHTRMTYGLAGHKRTESYWYHRNSNAFFKLLYQGKFWGLCEEGTAMAYDICQYLNIKANYAGSYDLNHSWCGIWVTDKNNTSYWHGIYTASYGYNMKSSVPQNNRKLTKAQVNKYVCTPNKQTQIVVSAKRITTPTTRPVTTAPSITTQAPVQTPAPTPKPSPTTTTVIFNTPEPPEPEETETPVATTEPTKAPVVTQEPTPTPIITPEPTVEPTPAPVPTETLVPQRIVIPYNEHGYTCAGCNPLNPPPIRHTDNNNPYITNSKTTYKNYVVYKHVIGTKVRWFDANGNEYIDINSDGNIMNELIQLAG